MTESARPAVLIATLLHESGPTGVQTHFNAFRKYLRQVGVDNALVTPFDAPKILVYPVFALRRVIDPISGAASVWWYRYWHAFFLKLALRKRLKMTKNCVIYAQCPLSACAALKARADSDQRVVLVVHFNCSQADEWSEKGKIHRHGWMAHSIRILEEKTLLALDGIVYVSRFMQGLLEERIPALNRIDHAVIPNFCEPVTEAGETLEPVDIISVGTLEPRKNQQFLLRVLAEASRCGQQYSLTLIGDGPDRAALEDLARSLDITQQVRFLGYCRNAVQLMRYAKVYVHAATVENLPLSMIEAMACSLPILAPRVGGIPDLFEEGEQGFFWSTDDIESAAQILGRILENPATMRRLSAAARQRFDDRFSVNKVAHRLLIFLSGVNVPSFAINDTPECIMND